MVVDQSRCEGLGRPGLGMGAPSRRRRRCRTPPLPRRRYRHSCCVVVQECCGITEGLEDVGG